MPTARRFHAARATWGVLLALACLHAVPAPAVAQTPSDLWSATLTVGATTTDATLFGYHSSAGGFDGDALSETEFALPDRRPLVVTELTNDNDDDSGTLTLGLDGTTTWLETASNRNLLTLHVGSNMFAFMSGTFSATEDEAMTWTSSGLTWADGNSIAVKITTTGSVPSPNNLPQFQNLSASYEINENTAAETVITQLEATDDDMDTLNFVLRGTDRRSFDVNMSNQLVTADGVDYDFETQSDYQLTVEVDDDYGGIVTSDLTVTLIDVDEPPSAPDPPTVSPVSGSTSSLSVTWTAPDNTGKPDIASYDLQYRKGTSGPFTDGPQDVADTMATIDGLDANASYEVQVRATNDDGDGPWSDAGMR